MSFLVEQTLSSPAARLPQTQIKNRRQENAFSPYGKRFTETSTNKSAISARRNDQINQKNEKIRKLETKNSRMQQKLAQYDQQKQALENTLKERIQMYKRIIKQKQEKSQQMLELIQSQFSQQMKQLSQQKQQEENFFEQQSKIMAHKIHILEGQNLQLEQKVNKHLSFHGDLNSEIQKLKTQNGALRQQYNAMLIEKKSQIQKLQAKLEKLDREWKEEKFQLKDDFDRKSQIITEKMKELQDKFQNQIKSLESLRQSENAFKDNQIIELKRTVETERLKFLHAFQEQKLKYGHIIQTENLKNQKLIDEEIKRIMDVLHTKQAAIDMLNRDIAQLNKSLQLSREQNSNLAEQIQSSKNQQKNLQQQIYQRSQTFSKEKNHLITIIQELKQEVRFSQINYVREKDRNQSIYGENARLQAASSNRDLMVLEINELRQLLFESSKEIQICRDKFLVYQKQNKRLLFQLERIGAQNNSLLRIRRDLEEQAIKWRQNYLRVAK